MAEDEKKSFMENANEYADKYEVAIKENTAAFLNVASECVKRGIKTVEKVVEDAKKIGCDIKDKSVQGILNAKQEAQEKLDNIKNKIGQAKNTVKSKAMDVKNGVKKGAEKTTGAVIAVGRLGKNATIRGAKTVKNAFTTTKGTAQKALSAVSEWFKARGKNLQELGEAAKAKVGQARNAVVTGVKNVKGKVVDVAETVALYGMEAKDKVVNTVKDKAETVALYGMEAKDKVVNTVKDKAETAALYGMEAKDKVVNTAEKVTGAVIAVGRLGKNATIRGAKTVKNAFTTTKGTAQKALSAVSEWFKARGKNLQELGEAAKAKVGQARNAVVTGVKNVKGKVVEGAEKVTGAVIATKKITEESFQNASSKFQSRINYSIINMARGAKSFMKGFLDRIENNAISREERNQEKQSERESSKQKEQNNDEMSK